MTTNTITATARIEKTEDGFVVRQTWNAPTDRTEGMGLHLPTRNQAERYAAAVNAGATYKNARIATDVTGATYVASTQLVFGKHFEHSMREIGF